MASTGRPGPPWTGYWGCRRAGGAGKRRPCCASRSSRSPAGCISATAGASPGLAGQELRCRQDGRSTALRPSFRSSVPRWRQGPTAILGVIRTGPLAAAVLPATGRRRDPYFPAKPRGHVYLVHEALVLRKVLLVGARARTEPVRQPGRQLHASIVD